MKLALIIVVSSICVYINRANGKSFKDFYANSPNNFKGQVKHFASPVVIRDRRQSNSRFQDILNDAKAKCVHEMNMDPSVMERALMYEEYPSKREKCLLLCMLKKTKLMENGNKLSIKTIAHIANAVSSNNTLVGSLAEAFVNNCNKGIRTEEPCEAAYHINKCIGKELKFRNLKLYY